jgi:hypothetical protein
MSRNEPYQYSPSKRLPAISAAMVIVLLVSVRPASAQQDRVPVQADLLKGVRQFLGWDQDAAH